MFLFSKITKTKYGNKSVIQIDPIVLATSYYSLFSLFLYIYWLIDLNLLYLFSLRIYSPTSRPNYSAAYRTFSLGWLWYIVIFNRMCHIPKYSFMPSPSPKQVFSILQISIRIHPVNPNSRVLFLNHSLTSHIPSFIKSLWFHAYTLQNPFTSTPLIQAPKSSFIIILLLFKIFLSIRKPKEYFKDTNLIISLPCSIASHWFKNKVSNP